MNRTETNALLTFIAAHDRRTTGDSEIMAWNETLADVEFRDARAAVIDHYRESEKWLTASAVLHRVRATRRDKRDRDVLTEITNRTGTNNHRAHVAAIHREMNWAGDGNEMRNEAREFVCPWCRALPGTPCLRPSRSRRAVAGREPITGTHPARLRLVVACPLCDAGRGVRCRHDAQRDRDTRRGVWVPRRRSRADRRPETPADDPTPAFDAIGVDPDR